MHELRTKIGLLSGKTEMICGAPSLQHRLRRAVSWLQRGDAEIDTDAKYIFWWIAFNAAYAIESKREPEWRRRERYFGTLVPLDIHRRVFRALATELRPAVEEIVGNVYVYRGFWECLTDRLFDWQHWHERRSFERDRAFVMEKLGSSGDSGSLQAQLRVNAIVPDNDIAVVLRTLFDRLNVLRNQLMHGCATQDGYLNRRQVDAGAMVLGPLPCEFLDVMSDNPREDWGALAYPVRDDIREDRHRRLR